MQTDSWLVPILAKRSPDSIRVLAQLVEAVLRKGECSANDIEGTFQQPNIIGATFNVLHKFGIANSGKRVRTTGKQKHARRVDVYVVENYGKLRQAQEHMRSMILPVETPVQQELF